MLEYQGEGRSTILLQGLLTKYVGHYCCFYIILECGGWVWKLRPLARKLSYEASGV